MAGLDGGTTYPVPQPFIVIATQNPLERGCLSASRGTA